MLNSLKIRQNLLKITTTNFILIMEKTRIFMRKKFSVISLYFLQFFYGVILLAPSKEALRQQLDHLQNFCETWALTVNLKNTRIMDFQKRPRCQGNPNKFLLGSADIEHTHNYTYLCLKISSTGNFLFWPLMISKTREEGLFFAP